MVRGDGDDAASDGPQPPSSPDLTDVVPPTPDGVLSGSPRSGAQVIRPSDVAGASTEAPTVGSMPGRYHCCNVVLRLFCVKWTAIVLGPFYRRAVL